jgi:hypothetical protein
VTPVVQDLPVQIIRYPNRRAGGSSEPLLDHVSLFHEGKADGPPTPNPQAPRTFPLPRCAGPHHNRSLASLPWSRIVPSPRSLGAESFPRLAPWEPTPHT